MADPVIGEAGGINIDSFFVQTINYAKNVSNEKRTDLFTCYILDSVTSLLKPEFDIIAGVFYNVKNGSSFITPKDSSKNLSNENKHWCFCCLPRQNVN